MWDHIQKYWLTYAMGIVAGGLGALWKWVRGKFRTLDAMKEATDPITAAAVGVVSGLAATGINQAVKQLGKTE